MIIRVGRQADKLLSRVDTQLQDLKADADKVSSKLTAQHVLGTCRVYTDAVLHANQVVATCPEGWMGELKRNDNDRRSLTAH